MDEKIEVSKCCRADVEEVFDGADEFVLNACKKCGQECKLISICAKCEDTGVYDDWETVDNLITKKCPCRAEVETEMKGENLMALAN